MKLNQQSGSPLYGSEASSSGFKIYEYLLVLQPHEELWQRIVKVKQEFAEKYESDHARWGKSHITLVNFLQHEMMEPRIIDRVKLIAMGFPPVKIELKDFGSLPSHTIYINITSKVPIQNLVKQIRSQTQLLMKLNKDNKPHFIMEPHLTIARKLQPWQYEQGWLEYRHRHFTGRFIASDMLLLRRPINEMKYQIVQRFAFENLPVGITQGSLFSPLSPEGET